MYHVFAEGALGHEEIVRGAKEAQVFRIVGAAEGVGVDVIEVEAAGFRAAVAGGGGEGALVVVAGDYRAANGDGNAAPASAKASAWFGGAGDVATCCAVRWERFSGRRRWGLLRFARNDRDGGGHSR